MAARIRREQNKRERDEKRAAALMYLLYKNSMGRLAKPLTAAQVKSAEVYVRKFKPDLAATQVTAEVSQTTVIRSPEVAKDAETWAQTHAPDQGSAADSVAVSGELVGPRPH